MANGTNTDAHLFEAAPASAVGEDATWISLWDAETGGTFLGRKPISTDPAPLTLGQPYELAAGALDLINPTSGFDSNGVAVESGYTEAMMRRAINGMIGARLWVGVHTDDPGANGTANLVTDIGRIEFVLADFAVT